MKNDLISFALVITIAIGIMFAASTVEAPKQNVDVTIYTADWCGECPHFIKEMRKAYDSIKIVNIDTLENSGFDKNIKSIPTMVIY